MCCLADSDPLVFFFSGSESIGIEAGHNTLVQYLLLIYRFSVPGCVFKQIINVLQLKAAADELVELEQKPA